jgi:hypothetical protein
MRIHVENHTLAALVAGDRHATEPATPSEAASLAEIVAIDTLRHGDGAWALAPDTATGRIEALLDAHDRAEVWEGEPLTARQRAVAALVTVVIGGGAFIAAVMVMTSVVSVITGAITGPRLVPGEPMPIVTSTGRDVVCDVAAQAGDVITLDCPLSVVDR